MNPITDATLRLIARAAGQAFPIRETSAIVPDQGAALGVAILRMVSEERILAVAWGPLGRQPQVVTNPAPLTRDVAFLEPFAIGLNAYVEQQLAAGALPRIWLPHRAAMTAIDVLGLRYQRNRNAAEMIQRMGWQCQAFAREVRFAGQQAVVVADELLRQHVITGQSPAEDLHPGALLAWVSPPAGTDAIAAAEAAALEPAAAMLPKDDDTRAEELYPMLREPRRVADAAAGEIARIFQRGVLREWELLTRLRRTFLELRLPPVAGLDQLAAETLARLSFGLARVVSEPGRPHSLARRFDTVAYANDLHDYLQTTGDPILRAEARKAGRVVRGQVVATGRTEQGTVTVVLRTEQSALHPRVGRSLRLLGASTEGRVIRMDALPTGGTELEIDLEVRRASRLPALRAETEWGPTPPPNLRKYQNEVYEQMAEDADPLVYDTTRPAAAPRPVQAVRLADVADRLRRRR